MSDIHVDKVSDSMSEQSLSISEAIENQSVTNASQNRNKYNKFKTVIQTQDSLAPPTKGNSAKKIIKQYTEMTIRTQAFIDEDIDEQSFIE